MQVNHIRLAVIALAAATGFANATTKNEEHPPKQSGSTQQQQQTGTVKGTQNVDLKNVGGVKDSGNSAAIAGVKNSGNSAIKNAGNSTTKVRTGDVNTTATGGKSASKSAAASTSAAASKSASSVGAGAGSATVTGGNFESFGVAWAPIVHGGVATVPSASVAVIPGVCGPLLRSYEQPIMGTIVQSDGTTTQAVVGHRTVAAPLGNWDGTPLYQPFRVAFVAGEVVLEGSMVNSFAAVTSTSAAVSFSFGLFHKGDAIQAGAAKSDAIQQLVVQERVVPCIYARPAAPVTQVQYERMLPYVKPLGG